MNELIKVHELLPEKIFAVGGADEIIKKLEEEYDAFVPDVSTSKGRKEVASFSAKFSKSKTAIDAIGKELKSKYKKMIDPIDAERKRIRDACDEYRTKSRQPLTRFEEEQERIKREKQYHEDWDEAKTQNELIDREREIERKEEAIRLAEEERLENERLLKEEAENARLGKEREERIAKDAAEKAEADKKAVEEKAKRDKEEYEAKLKRTEEQAKLDAEFAEKKRLSDIQAEKDKAELEKRREAERIKREQEEKDEAEKTRIAEEKRIEEERIADKQHRKNIETSAVTDFVINGVEVETAKAVVKLLADELISYVRIEY